MDDVQDCSGSRPECITEINKIKNAVFGNGHPEQSLIVRTHRIERQLQQIQRLSWATLSGIGMLLVKIASTWIDQLMKG